MPKYGLISNTDANTLELTIKLIFEHFPDEVINVTEIGVYAGETGNGIIEFIEGNGRKCFLTGVDNNKDKEPLRFQYDNLIIGDADEVAYRIEDNSQHLIFIDACHCFAHVVSNLFSYTPKIKQGGYLAFHDTGKHIQPLKGFQHGYKENPDAYISCRKALRSIGLLDTKYIALEADGTFLEDWELIFDEADDKNLAGGVTIFRKI